MVRTITQVVADMARSNRFALGPPSRSAPRRGRPVRAGA
jgi:hypothetical protein